MLPRTLEPEVMDTREEAVDYDAMDHSQVNRAFVDDFLAAVRAGRSELPRSLAILDCGTGTALIPIELCRRGVAWRITAVDLAAEMLQVARRNVDAAGLAKRIALQRVDAKRMPFPDGTFDAVMSNSIVHHIPEPRLVLAEMHRVLRPGGLLFARDLLRPEDVGTVERLVDAYAGDANAHQRSMFRASLCAALTLQEVRDLLVELKLPPQWAQQTSDRHWTICGRTLGEPGGESAEWSTGHEEAGG